MDTKKSPLKERPFTDDSLKESSLRKRSIRKRSIKKCSFKKRSMTERSLTERSLPERSIKKCSFKKRSLTERSLTKKQASGGRLLAAAICFGFPYLKVKKYCVHPHELVAASLIAQIPGSVYSKKGRIRAVSLFCVSELHLFYDNPQIGEDPDFLKWYNAILGIVQTVLLKEWIKNDRVSEKSERKSA